MQKRFARELAAAVGCARESEGIVKGTEIKFCIYFKDNKLLSVTRFSQVFKSRANERAKRVRMRVCRVPALIRRPVIQPPTSEREGRVRGNR